MTIAESENVLKRIETFRATALKVPTRVVIFKTAWYPEIIAPLTQSAVEYLKTQGVSENSIDIVPVPGSFELPLAIEMVYSSHLRPQIGVVLGCVIRGQTPHFEFVCETVTRGVSESSLKYKIPTGFGVLTVDSLSQAKERTNKGAEAAQAALAMFNLGENLKGSL